MWSDWSLGQLLQVQMRIATLKIAYNSLVIALVVGDMKVIYGKSWAGNLVVRFNLGPLIQGQTRIGVKV